MKKIEVVAAVILKERGCFATQRGYGEFEGLWEFPGGKIEPGENCDEALKREIEEELGVNIVVNDFLCTTDYDYPSFHITMHCYLCSIESGNIELREHRSACWLTVGSIDSVEWLPADRAVVEKLKMIL